MYCRFDEKKQKITQTQFSFITIFIMAISDFTKNKA